MKVLAGDIGGTNTRLLVSDRDNSNFVTIAEKSYPSAQYASLQEVINVFLTQHNITEKIDAACFAVAGPVKSGVAKITNLPWWISEEQLIQELKIPVVSLVNDFMAVALGISMLKDEDISLIQKGASNNNPVHPDAAVIGAGTGFGASHRVWIADMYHILPSETGHTGFTPADKLQTDLLAWLQTKNNHVSLESILSGSGIYTIYQFLSETRDYSESQRIRNTLQEGDPAKVIAEHALANDDDLCVSTLDTFVNIYGSIAGDVALQYYPVDEVYIAGGIAPKIEKKLCSSVFLNAFTNKGLMTANMQQIVIKLIRNENVGLLGALSCLVQ